MKDRAQWGLVASALCFSCGASSAPPSAAVELPSLDPNYSERDLRDEVIYEALTDRFEDGDSSNDSVGGVATVPGDLSRYQGGDWRGLAQRLEYIRDLGATALWISPIVDNVAREPNQDGYHGYWASDFTRLNPHFGELADLQALVSKAHALGLRVFVDVAPNHTGRVFSYDFDGSGQPNPHEPGFASSGPYLAALHWDSRPALFLGAAPANAPTDAPSAALQTLRLDDRHFHRRGNITNFADPSQVELGDFPLGLRDLATENPDVTQGLVDTYAEWVRLSDVDGFRLDAVPCIERAFWVAFCSGLRARVAALGKSHFFLFGEVFKPEAEIIASYSASPGSLDSALDFSFKTQVVNEYLLQGGAPALARAALEADRALYATQPQPNGVGLDPWQARVGFVDNHDTGRILSALSDPYAARVALTLLFTIDAIPALYYGTEQGFSGGPSDAGRERLWPTGFDRSAPLFGFVRRLSALRRASSALRHGSLEVRYASEHDGRSNEPDAGLLAFERASERERVLVAVNGHAFHSASAKVQTHFTPGTHLVDALAHQRTFEVDAQRDVELTLAPRSSVVLVPRTE